MGQPARNRRSKSPRLIRVGRTPVGRPRHAIRYGKRVTPTPPPVAVSTETEPAPPAEPGLPLDEGEPIAEGGGFWRSALLVCLLGLAVTAARFHPEKVTALKERAEGLYARWVAGIPVAASHAAAAPIAAPTPVASAAETAAPTTPEGPPARQTTGIAHDGYESIRGGVLIAPSTFEPEADGSFDLAIHFHGDVAIVRESYERAGVNAALAIVNLGVGSAVYRDGFNRPGSFEALVAQIKRGVARRGVKNPKLRRLALTAWSAGYASIEAILLHREPPPRNADPLDALLVFDGIHCGFEINDPTKYRFSSLAPFVRAARAAAEGQIMFQLTHSEIDPKTYASTTVTAGHLLESVGARAVESPMLPVPEEIKLRSAPRKKPMIPTADTKVGAFRVRGFQGTWRAHHAAHLTQMAVVGLDELALRWSGPPRSGL